MRKNLLFLVLALAAYAGYAQNVGINTTGAAPNASAILDVSSANKGVLLPQVSLTSLTDAVTIASPATGLIVYNTNPAIQGGVGYFWNTGTPLAPSWMGIGKQKFVYQVYGTGSRTAVTSTVHTLQPGLTQTFTIPAGQTADVQILASIGCNNNATTAGAFSLVDFVIYVDGTFLPQGGWNRFGMYNPNPAAASGNAFNTSAINTFTTLGAGTHTIEVRTARIAGNIAVNIGGDCFIATDCGELTIIIMYK